MPDTKLHHVGGVKADEIDEEQFPQLFACVPWKHPVEIITKCKSIEEAFFYLRLTVQESLSKQGLVNCINANWYKLNMSPSVIKKIIKVLKETGKIKRIRALLRNSNIRSYGTLHRFLSLCSAEATPVVAHKFSHLPSANITNI